MRRQIIADGSLWSSPTIPKLQVRQDEHGGDPTESEVTAVTDLPPDALDLIDVVRDHLGGKVTDDWAEGQDSLRFVLYEALAVSIDRDDYGSGRCWGISVILGEGFSVSDLLGSDLTLLETRDQFDKALDAVDAYARLRLGPEYLATFDATRTSG